MVIDRLADALAARLGGSSRGSSSGATAVHSRGGARRKGEKRSAALLGETVDDLLAHIKSNPGQRIEQIASGLGISTQELKLPAQKLIASRKVKTRGQRRGTKYFAA